MPQAGADAVRKAFADDRAGHLKLAAALVGEAAAEAAVEGAERRLDEMIPTMAYVDRPEGYPMAGALFGCAGYLAVYLELAERGVDVHDFGRTLMEQFTEQMAEADEAKPPDPEAGKRWQEAAAESQRGARKGEFVFEEVAGTTPDEWGMNIKSCAICFHFAKYDAIDLVPYMCATDDVVSDRYNQGLRRTGTIALGAHQCDFRYEKRGEPLRVADQYPVKIRLSATRTE